jgi:hypothetical protein
VVVLAPHVAKKFVCAVIISAGGSMLLASKAALAQNSLEMASVAYSGTKVNAQLHAVRATASGDYFSSPGSGYTTTVMFNGAYNISDQADSYGVLKTTKERRGSLSVSQSFGPLSTVSVSAGYIKSTGFSRFDTLTVGQWWNKATILTEVTAVLSRSDRLARDYQDTDGMRVRVAPRVDGKTWRLGLTWLARPDLMVLGSASTTSSSDRPRSNASSIEGRYFFAATKTALHIGVDTYEDTAQVEKVTDFGQVSSRTANFGVHQHLSDRWIASLMMREHGEREVPRSMESITIKRRSQELRGKIRWRQVSGPVTDDVSEVYGFAGQYVSYDQSMSIQHVGFGGRYVL